MPKNLGKTENDTPTQTEILKELSNIKKRENLDPTDNTDWKTKFFERFDWTDALLAQHEKQAVEGILVEYHVIFARSRKGVVMNTEFKIKLTPKDNKAIYNRGLPMPIHLTADVIVELALM